MNSFFSVVQEALRNYIVNIGNDEAVVVSGGSQDMITHEYVARRNLICAVENMVVYGLPGATAEEQSTAADLIEKVSNTLADPIFAKIIELANEQPDVVNVEEFEKFYKELPQNGKSAIRRLFDHGGIWPLIKTVAAEDDDGRCWYEVHLPASVVGTTTEMPEDWYLMQFSCSYTVGMPTAEAGVIGAKLDIAKICQRLDSYEKELASKDLLPDAASLHKEPDEYTLACISQDKHRLALKSVGLDGMNAVIEFAFRNAKFHIGENSGLLNEDYIKWAYVPIDLVHACIKAFDDVTAVGVALAKYCKLNVNAMRTEFKKLGSNFFSDMDKGSIYLVNHERYAVWLTQAWLTSYDSWNAKDNPEIALLHDSHQPLITYSLLPEECILRGYGLWYSICIADVCNSSAELEVAVSGIMATMKNKNALAVIKAVDGVLDPVLAHDLMSWDKEGILELLCSGRMPAEAEAANTMPGFSIQYDGYTLQRMPKTSKYQLRVGDFAACCQSQQGAGASLIPVILLEDNVDNYYITLPSGEPVGDMVIWRGQDKYVIDSIELRKVLPTSVVRELILMAAKEFDMPLMVSLRNGIFMLETKDKAVMFEGRTSGMYACKYLCSAYTDVGINATVFQVTEEMPLLPSDDLQEAN